MSARSDPPFRPLRGFVLRAHFLASKTGKLIPLGFVYWISTCVCVFFLHSKKSSQQIFVGPRYMPSTVQGVENTRRIKRSII